MRFLASSDSRVEPVMLIDCDLPLAVSFAETLSMPLESMSKVTSILGVPRGAGGSPPRLY